MGEKTFAEKYPQLCRGNGWPIARFPAGPETPVYSPFEWKKMGRSVRRRGEGYIISSPPSQMEMQMSKVEMMSSKAVHARRRAIG